MGTLAEAKKLTSRSCAGRDALVINETEERPQLEKVTRRASTRRPQSMTHGMIAVAPMPDAFGAAQGRRRGRLPPILRSC